MKVNKLVMAMNAINPCGKQANAIIKKMGYPETQIIQKKLKNGNIALLQSNDTGVDSFCIVSKDGGRIETITKNLITIRHGKVEHMWNKTRIYTDSHGNQGQSCLERHFLNGKLKEDTSL